MGRGWPSRRGARGRAVGGDAAEGIGDAACDGSFDLGEDFLHLGGAESGLDAGAFGGELAGVAGAVVAPDTVGFDRVDGDGGGDDGLVDGHPLELDLVGLEVAETEALGEGTDRAESLEVFLEVFLGRIGLGGGDDGCGDDSDVDFGNAVGLLGEECGPAVGEACGPFVGGDQTADAAELGEGDVELFGVEAGAAGDLGLPGFEAGAESVDLGLHLIAEELDDETEIAARVGHLEAEDDLGLDEFGDPGSAVLGAADETGLFGFADEQEPVQAALDAEHLAHVTAEEVFFLEERVLGLGEGHVTEADFLIADGTDDALARVGRELGHGALHEEDDHQEGHPDDHDPLLALADRPEHGWRLPWRVGACERRVAPGRGGRPRAGPACAGGAGRCIRT